MIATEAPRILLCCLRNLSRGVATLPALCALRNRFPRGCLGWICEQDLAPLLEGHLALDQLLVVDTNWHQSCRKVRQLRARLHAQRFGVALDFQSDTASSLAGWLSAAAIRIGFQRPAARGVSRLLNNHRVATESSLPAHRNLELLGPIGIEQDKPQFRVPRQQSAELRIDDWIVDSHLTCGFLVVHPGGGANARQDPQLGRVARCLGERYQIPTVVAGIADDTPIRAASVVAHAGGHAIQGPPLTLPQFVALLRRAASLLTFDPDSSALAAALDTPQVTLSPHALACSDPLQSLAAGPLLSLFAAARQSSSTRPTAGAAGLLRAA